MFRLFEAPEISIVDTVLVLLVIITRIFNFIQFGMVWPVSTSLTDLDV